MFRPLVATLCTLLLLLPTAQAEEVNLYSARKEALIKPLLDRFTAETGIRVNLVTGKADALLQRLQSEGRNSPADLLLTTDAGRLYRAKQAGVLQSLHAPELTALVPARYRDQDGYWFGLSLRARPIFYVPGRIDPAHIDSYEALADPKLKGRICIRSSNNIYNQSLVASMIAAHGERETGAWAEGLVANLARRPTGGDRDQIKAAAAGLCDIAVANSYYYGAMLASDDAAERGAAEKVALHWPNQQGRGAHVNISGIGVTAAAKHPQAAQQLIAYLLSDAAQQWYAEVNQEYPLRDDLPLSSELQRWGAFKADSVAMDQLGEHNSAALRLMDRAGWR